MVVIAIAGLPGSGSTTVAKILSQKINVPYFSAGQLFKDIAQGTWEQQYYAPLFKQLCQKQNIILPSFSTTPQARASLTLWNTSLGKNPAFHHSIESLQQHLANKGNIIIDGKLSVAMVKNATLRVWLEGPLDVRGERTARRDAIPQEEAKTILQERERIHTAEWLRMYGIDYHGQAHQADLIIDTGRKSAVEIASEIANKISFS